MTVARVTPWARHKRVMRVVFLVSRVPRWALYLVLCVAFSVSRRVPRPLGAFRDTCDSS